MTIFKRTIIWAAALVFVSIAASAGAKTLKASHQWPGGKGDVRDEMVQIIAKEVAKADVDLEIKIYPGKSLFKPKEQWNAMVKGQLDISAFPLDYASGRHAQFSATLMPGLVKNHDHAQRLNDSPFMDDIKKLSTMPELLYWPMPGWPVVLLLRSTVFWNRNLSPGR